MNCRGCGRPLWDGDHRIKYCDSCRERRDIALEVDEIDLDEVDVYMTEETRKTLIDRSRGYA